MGRMDEKKKERDIDQIDGENDFNYCVEERFGITQEFVAQKI